MDWLDTTVGIQHCVPGRSIPDRESGNDSRGGQIVGSVPFVLCGVYAFVSLIDPYIPQH